MTRASGSTQLEVARIQSEINRLFESLLRLREGGSSSGAWTPGVDVAEAGDRVIVEVELPGVDPQSIGVTAQGGHLHLVGHKPPDASHAGHGVRVLHDERETGDFALAIPITTSVNTRKAQARLDRGVLRVELPKVPNRRGESVSVPIEIAD
jgi:HSP20 family protein